jgi:hypothetical protein
MWTLTLIILINGGASPSKVEEYKFASAVQCLAAQRKYETETKLGYCSADPKGKTK